jgi:hypothetical protein
MWATHVTYNKVTPVSPSGPQITKTHTSCPIWSPVDQNPYHFCPHRGHMGYKLARWFPLCTWKTHVGPIYFASWVISHCKLGNRLNILYVLANKISLICQTAILILTSGPWINTNLGQMWFPAAAAYRNFYSVSKYRSLYICPHMLILPSSCGTKPRLIHFLFTFTWPEKICTFLRHFAWLSCLIWSMNLPVKCTCPVQFHLKVVSWI